MPFSTYEKAICRTNEGSSSSEAPDVNTLEPIAIAGVFMSVSSVEILSA